MKFCINQLRGKFSYFLNLFFSSILRIDAEKDEDGRMDIMFDRLMLMELRENVSKLDPSSFAEIKSYKV